MHSVRLGRTGLTVGVAGLGTGGKSRVGQASGASVGHSIAVVHAALDAGVTLIDTAEGYGTEEIVGAAVKGRRDRVVISTKFHVTKKGAPLGGTDLIDRAELIRRLDESLARLGTDYVDILHLHGVTTEQYDHCRDELVPALLALRDAGKLRFIGLTERFVHDTRHAMLDRALADDLWDVVMVGLNFVNQTALRQVLPTTKRNGIGTLCMFAVRGPLARPDTANALVAKLVGTGEIDPRHIDAADPLGFLTADADARSLTDAAYRFCRHAPGIDVVLTGTGDIAHLEENLRSIDAGPLPETVTRRLALIFGKVESESAEP